MKRFARLLRQSPPMVVALLALFVALSGTAVATTSALITGKQIADSSISGADVKNKSLTPADFRGSVRGPRGGPGPRGEQGEEGEEGEPGEDGDDGLDGDDGEDGTDATINGVVAGGDLAGTFPNPTLRGLPAARVFNNLLQSVTSGTDVRVALGAEEYVRGLTHDTASSDCSAPPAGSCFVTVSRAGVYLITGNVVWAANATGSRTLQLRLYPPDGFLAADTRSAASAATAQDVATVARLAVGESVAMVASQTSGGDLDLLSPHATLTVTWLGPS